MAKRKVVYFLLLLLLPSFIQNFSGPTNTLSPLPQLNGQPDINLVIPRCMPQCLPDSMGTYIRDTLAQVTWPAHTPLATRSSFADAPAVQLPDAPAKF